VEGRNGERERWGEGRREGRNEGRNEGRREGGREGGRVEGEKQPVQVCSVG